ncbi:hypothetical protein VPH35_092323 [Triticum aestivum]|uniref:uncharacterized protein n=1 Tax=Triticum aestivum TaxID=4565 RepID=UPI0008454956|nr:uncharacterized protein LOC123113220 [Triticum aestivum]
MEDFSAGATTMDERRFDMVPVWVRAYGVPAGSMSWETGELVGEQVGKVLEVDTGANADSTGAFMRIKVRMDITVPIMRFVTCFIQDDEEDMTTLGDVSGGGLEPRFQRRLRGPRPPGGRQGQGSGCRPWSFAGHLLVMEDFAGGATTVDERRFDTVLIWVRAYGVPAGSMSKETRELVGERVGKVLEVDTAANADSTGAFMRVKVRMDITVPIMRFVTCFIQDDEEDMTTLGDDEKEERRRSSPLPTRISPTSAMAAGYLGIQRSHARLDLQERGAGSLGHG